MNNATPTHLNASDLVQYDAKWEESEERWHTVSLKVVPDLNGLRVACQAGDVMSNSLTIDLDNGE